MKPKAPAILITEPDGNQGVTGPAFVDVVVGGSGITV